MSFGVSPAYFNSSRRYLKKIVLPVTPEGTACPPELTPGDTNTVPGCPVVPLLIELPLKELPEMPVELPVELPIELTVPVVPVVPILWELTPWVPNPVVSACVPNPDVPTPVVPGWVMMP